MVTYHKVLLKYSGFLQVFFSVLKCISRCFSPFSLCDMCSDLRNEVLPAVSIVHPSWFVCCRLLLLGEGLSLWPDFAPRRTLSIPALQSAESIDKRVEYFKIVLLLHFKFLLVLQINPLKMFSKI